jgi:glyoxylate reductase
LTQRPRIVVTREIPKAGLEVLRAAGETWVSPHDRPLDRDELFEAVAGAEGIVTMLHDPVDDAFLDAAGPQLRVVANFAVGFNNVDVEACARRGVIATNTPGVLTDATADLAFALILIATRRLGEAERFVRSGQSWSWNTFFMLGAGIQGKTLGVVGLGAIGTAVARRARAFGMDVIYNAPSRKPEAEAELGARFADFYDLLESADVVTLHCPLTDETHHLVNVKSLERMKPSAYLINTTRGPVVDEPALVAALRDGTIAGAGLDVYEDEPEIHPGLLELENVVLIPHLGSATVETRDAMATLAAENVAAVLRGEPAKTPITS